MEAIESKPNGADTPLNVSNAVKNLTESVNYIRNFKNPVSFTSHQKQGQQTTNSLVALGIHCILKGSALQKKSNVKRLTK